MTTKQINDYCKLDIETSKVLKQAINTLNLSARAYYRVVKLARTIADLE
jgi:magnesium chelatase family protein